MSEKGICCWKHFKTPASARLRVGVLVKIAYLLRVLVQVLAFYLKLTD